MRLANLTQASFNCTMMGSLRGALDYHGIPVSDAFLYGASGHAFVLNIHDELCPSGPYVWDRQRVAEPLTNVGLRLEPLGFFHTGSTPDERSGAESRLRESLGAGMPCMFTNMEFQLITGTDDTGFLTAQPWASNDKYPPSHLTFGTWDELGDGFHMNLHVLHRCEPAEPRKAVLDSLRYAADVWRTPPAGDPHYGMGPNGYANWRKAVETGHGASHGNWWNGVVWAECRARAADHVREIAPLLPSDAEAEALAEGYAAVAGLLERCADGEREAAEKLELLTEARAYEERCVARIEALLTAVG